MEDDVAARLDKLEAKVDELLTILAVSGGLLAAVAPLPGPLDRDPERVEQQIEIARVEPLVGNECSLDLTHMHKAGADQ